MVDILINGLFLVEGYLKAFDGGNFFLNDSYAIQTVTINFDFRSI